jgi:hypothetical protein
MDGKPDQIEDGNLERGLNAAGYEWYSTNH